MKYTTLKQKHLAHQKGCKMTAAARTMDEAERLRQQRNKISEANRILIELGAPVPEGFRMVSVSRDILTQTTYEYAMVVPVALDDQQIADLLIDDEYGDIEAVNNGSSEMIDRDRDRENIEICDWEYDPSNAYHRRANNTARDYWQDRQADLPRTQTIAQQQNG